MERDLRTCLEVMASKCRQAFEAMGPAQRDVGFAEFPFGACGGAVELVGRLFVETLGIEGKYAGGVGHSELPRQQTHAWLEVNNFIVDVTYDQFQGTGLRGWVFEDSLWHAKFEEVERRELCIPPRGSWPMYPHATYAALRATVAANE